MRAQLLLRDLSLLLLNSSSVFCGCSLTHAATASCSVTTPISTSCNLKGWGSYTSCISAKHGMNFAFIKSSAIQQFEHSEVLKICDRIIQDCFLYLFLSPAKGPGSETICGNCWVNEDNPFHQKVGYCKPFAVTSGNTVRKRK